MKRKTNIKYLVIAILIPVLLVAFSSCNSNAPKRGDQAAGEELDEVVMADVWVIEEYEINDVPLTSQSPNAKETFPSVAEVAATNVAEEDAEDAMEEEIEQEVEKEMEEEMEEVAMEEEMEETYEIVTLAMLTEMVEEYEYIAENTYDVTEAMVPLDETQTLLSFNKKGDSKAAFQVVSDQSTGEIEQIIFVDKRHYDEYDVAVGMTGKEVKKVRRELKHMVHRGQVFLYDEDSNIMYLMDAENMVGDEITEEDVEEMEVSAIIWKDKKHHKELG